MASGTEPTGVRRIALSDARWRRVAEALGGDGGAARSRHAERRVLESVLWVLRHGRRWRDLDPGSPSGVTCWRHLRAWHADGRWIAAWERNLLDLDVRELLGWSAALLDWAVRDPGHVQRSSEGWRREALDALLRRTRTEGR